MFLSLKAYVRRFCISPVNWQRGNVLSGVVDKLFEASRTYEHGSVGKGCSWMVSSDVSSVVFHNGNWTAGCC